MLRPWTGAAPASPSPRPRFRDQAGFVEQFVALEHEFLVPRAAVGAEGRGDPIGAIVPQGGAGRGFGKSAQGGQDHRVDHRGNADTAVFPRQIEIPILPARLVARTGRALAGQAEIADRDDALFGPKAAVAIREGIKLFDIADGMMRLPFDPGAQTRLQGTVRQFERAGGQQAGVLQGQHTRLAARHGDEDGDQISRDTGRRSGTRHSLAARGTVVGGISAVFIPIFLAAEICGGFSPNV